LADAYAIFFAAPLLITLLSGPVLGEAAGFSRISASIVGFAGVLVVLKPSGSELISYGAAMGLIAVVAYSISALLLRRLGEKDATITIAFWFVATVGIGAAALAIPDWRPLERSHWPLLIIMGGTGSIAQVMITAAFRRASAAVVAPFDYSHMIWAVIYGYYIWGYIPGSRMWVGTAIIVSSGLYIIYREQRVRKRRLATVEID
jgi:drug/metabolite transporter (DMT)-like permease